MGFKFFGTAAIGIACALIGFCALVVLLNGPDSALADEAAVLAFVALGAGIISIFLAQVLHVTESPKPGGRTLENLDDGRDALDYTIIVPIFNRPELLVALHQKLEELLPGWQACGRGEIVVVDDGSTDSTPAVARRIAERSTLPMRVVSQANKGVSGARNRGFWEARGKIGVVIDSDCIPSPQWLPAMLDAIKSHPRALAFAHIYSERRVLYPLEASPSGAPFVGASFGLRVADYAELGGNCELFGGASRDDGDFYLNAKEHDLEVYEVEEARVWHPIRQQTNGTIFRGGLQHRYDNLLAKRHGDRALFYLGDALMGGSFAGHYPMTLAAYAFVLLAVYDLAAAVLGHTPPSIVQIAQIFIAMLVLWLVAQIVFMRVLGIEAKRWWEFVTANVCHAFGAAMGRLRGTLEYAFVLL